MAKKQFWYWNWINKKIRGSTHCWTDEEREKLYNLWDIQKKTYSEIVQIFKDTNKPAGSLEYHLKTHLGLASNSDVPGYDDYLKSQERCEYNNLKSMVSGEEKSKRKRRKRGKQNAIRGFGKLEINVETKKADNMIIHTVNPDIYCNYRVNNKVNNNKWSEIEEDKLDEMFAEKKSILEMSNFLNKTPSAIIAKLVDTGYIDNRRLAPGYDQYAEYNKQKKHVRLVKRNCQNTPTAGCIYCIFSDKTDNIYIGYTMNSISERFNAHVLSYYNNIRGLTSSEVFGDGANVTMMKLIELTTNKSGFEEMERRYINFYQCVNKMKSVEAVKKKYRRFKLDVNNFEIPCEYLRTLDCNIGSEKALLEYEHELIKKLAED